MKRLGLLAVLLLPMTWQTGTNSALGARETSPTAEFAPQSALAPSASGSWVITDLAPYGGYPSIAIDSDDLVHISYSKDGNLIYTRQYRMGNDIWWGTHTVTTGNVTHPSLALDENDWPYIAYFDGTAENLCWAWMPTESGWYTGTRDTAGVGDGFHPSAVMREGYLHIAYLNYTTSNVEYIKLIPGGGWPPTPDVVGGPAAIHGDISLALRSDAFPRISFVTTSGKLIYARYTGTVWEADEIDGDPEHVMGQCNSLALNADNRARIAYFDATNEDLRHISYLLLGWGSPAIVDNNSGSICGISLALDGEGYSHILYHKGDIPGSLRYAQQQSGSGWSFETVDGPASNCGTSSALALDSSGRPHVIYSCGHLRYAHRAFTVYLPAIMRGQ
ncbi:MAG: hypothetical protein JXA78_18770 [Anaerolineales bacterium]|nr:hypothetical protein [Anaerolineales bacterium]